MSGPYSTGAGRRLSRAFPPRCSRAPGSARGLLAAGASGLAAEALHDAVAIVVERQAGAHHQSDEHRGVQVLLLAHVGTEVRADPGAGQTPTGGRGAER